MLERFFEFIFHEILIPIIQLNENKNNFGNLLETFLIFNNFDEDKSCYSPFSFENVFCKILYFFVCLAFKSFMNNGT